MRECMAEGCPHPAAGASEWCRQHGSEPERDLAGDLDRLIRRVQGLALPRSFEAVGERGSALHHLGAARYSVERLDALASEVQGACTCGNGEAEDDRGAVLRCPVHGPDAR